MKTKLCLSMCACILLLVGSVDGQNPSAASSPMDVLKHDVGNWDCEFRLFTDPNGEPTVSKASERNHLLGENWLISEFKGEVMGVPFEGSGQFGYNSDTKKYVGSWVDSMSPNAMCMEGTWDAATKTMTNIGVTKDPSGAEMKTKAVVVYKDHDNHTMTMYMQVGGQDDWVKNMECIYKRRK